MTDTKKLILAAKNGDEDAFEKLICDNAPLIWSIVKRYLGRGADAEDLYQLGCLGLLKAIRGFDETLGNCFSTYAVPKISGEIRRFLRDDGAVKVSRTIKERAFKIKSTADELQKKLNRDPTISEISEACGFTIEEIAQAEAATAWTDSLNREINEDGLTLGETIGNQGIEERTLEYISLSDAIEKLSEREKTVIKLRFYKGLTQSRTAKVMQISQVQVSRIERSAISHLRENM